MRRKGKGREREGEKISTNLFSSWRGGSGEREREREREKERHALVQIFNSISNFNQSPYSFSSRDYI